MTKYILISKKFEGFLVFAYDKLGLLYHWENCTWGMSEEGKRFALKELRYCLHLHGFLEWVANGSFTVIKVEEDLSFARFWLEYDMARDRLKAEKIWNKLSDVERQYIFHNIKSYKRYIKANAGWYNQLYPETYLNGHWRDEWDKMMDATKAHQDKK